MATPASRSHQESFSWHTLDIVRKVVTFGLSYKARLFLSTSRPLKVSRFFDGRVVSGTPNLTSSVSEAKLAVSLQFVRSLQAQQCGTQWNLVCRGGLWTSNILAAQHLPCPV